MLRTVHARRSAFLAVALLVATAASAQEVRVVTSGGFTEAYKVLAPQFERQTKIKVVSGFGASMGATPDAIPNRLKRGEAIDVIILAAPGLDPLIKNGMVDAATRVDDALQSRIARLSGANRAAEERSAWVELEVGRCLAKGIERPLVRVDSAGAVFLASNPLDRA